MRPSEKFEAKDAQISPYRHAETSKACPELAVALSEVEGVVEWVEGEAEGAAESRNLF